MVYVSLPCPQNFISLFGWMEWRSRFTDRVMAGQPREGGSFHGTGSSRASTPAVSPKLAGRGQLKCDGTRAETRFLLSAKRTSPFNMAGGRQFTRLLATEVCASAVVMLDTPCSEAVWRVLATHSIRLFPLHFPSLRHRVPSLFNWSLPSIAKWLYSEHRDNCTAKS